MWIPKLHAKTPPSYISFPLLKISSTLGFNEITCYCCLVELEFLELLAKNGWHTRSVWEPNSAHWRTWQPSPIDRWTWSSHAPYWCATAKIHDEPDRDTTEGTFASTAVGVGGAKEHDQQLDQQKQQHELEVSRSSSSSSGSVSFSVKTVKKKLTN